jgi:hypothetical protein
MDLREKAASVGGQLGKQLLDFKASPDATGIYPVEFNLPKN